MSGEDTGPILSVVSPVYRAEKIVPELVSRLIKGLSDITEDFEIVLVEDGSVDGSWSAICRECEAEPRVKGVRLSRNFGQHYAITAGLESARGRHVVVMDCDLQDDPNDIAKLYAKALEGNDIVYGLKTERAHSLHRNFFAMIFFKLFNLLSDRQTASAQSGSFSLLSRKAVNAFLRFSDRHRHYLMIVRELGMPSGSVEVSHAKRFEGKSSYDLRKLIMHAIGGLTSQSTKLLKIAVGIGVVYFFAAIVGIGYLVIQYFLSGFRAGWASTMVLLLGSTGLLLIAIGILGVYIGNIYDQVRMRPLYIVYDRRNFATNGEVASEQGAGAESVLR